MYSLKLLFTILIALISHSRRCLWFVKVKVLGQYIIKQSLFFHAFWKMCPTYVAFVWRSIEKIYLYLRLSIDLPTFIYRFFACEYCNLRCWSPRFLNLMLWVCTKVLSYLWSKLLAFSSTVTIGSIYRLSYNRNFKLNIYSYSLRRLYKQSPSSNIWKCRNLILDLSSGNVTTLSVYLSLLENYISQEVILQQYHYHNRL